MSKRIYYHGTSVDSALLILRQGFKVGAESNGRNLGAGLYLTTRPGFAATWGDTVIRCRLMRGTRILWHTPVEPSIIKYLKREFGAGITEPTFAKVIPRNKQLTRSEAAHLWNYLLQRRYLKKVVRPSMLKVYRRLAANYPFIHKHLKRDGYDGVGMAQPSWPEILIFNPSNVIPLSAHSYTSSGWRGDWEKIIKLSPPFALSQFGKSSLTSPDRNRETA